MPNFKMHEVVEYALDNKEVLNEPLRKKNVIEGPINHIKENIRL